MDCLLSLEGFTVNKQRHTHTHYLDSTHIPMTDRGKAIDGAVLSGAEF